jgi:aurora kinase
MATTKTLEARFEHLSMKDEKENGNIDRAYGKQKVFGSMQSGWRSTSLI